MSLAVQHLMWFEQLFQMQGHVLLSWTEWIPVTGVNEHWKGETITVYQVAAHLPN